MERDMQKEFWEIAQASFPELFEYRSPPQFDESALVPDEEIYQDEAILAAIYDEDFQAEVKNNIQYSNAVYPVEVFDQLAAYTAEHHGLSRSQAAVAIARCIRVLEMPSQTQERTLYRLETEAENG